MFRQHQQSIYVAMKGLCQWIVFWSEVQSQKLFLVNVNNL